MLVSKDVQLEVAMCAERSPSELFEPLLKMDLSEQEWADIKRESDLQDLYRQPVEALFFRYAATRTADTDTRRKFTQLDDTMIKATQLIDELIADPVIRRNYLYIGNVGGQQPDLPLLLYARHVFATVRGEVARANFRFDTASQLLPKPGALQDFIYGLLFVQGMSRQASPPTSFAESSHNPKFHRYIQLCVSLAGPEETKKSIDYALKRALQQFNSDRVENPERWANHWDTADRQLKK